MKKVGRPTKYTPAYVSWAEKCARRGLTNVEIAQFLDIGVATLERWAIAYPEFRSALKCANAAADDRVERSLYRQAIVGNVTACIFWLKNRRREQWRDRYEFQNEGNFTPTWHDPTARPEGYDRKRLNGPNGKAPES